MARRSPIRTILVHTLLVAACLTTIVPFLIVLTESLKCPALGDDLTPHHFDLIPLRFQWRNYLMAWRAGKLGLAFGNSLLISITWTLGTVLVSAMAAYALGRRKCVGYRWFLLFFLGSLMFAGQMTIIPSFILYRSLGLYDSLAIFMIPGASAFTIYLLSHWFKAVPAEIEEAAIIDGCSEWGILFRIILPMSAPALSTVGFFAFLSSWNNFAGPFVFTENEKNLTIPLAIQMFPQGSLTLETARSAAIVLSIVPVVIVFVFLQRWFLRGISLGSLIK